MAGLRAANVNTVAVDAQNRRTIYAGIWGDKPLKTADSGITWSTLDSGLPDSGIVHVAVDPQNSSVIYATGGRGVFKSKDGGTSWSAVNTGLPYPNYETSDHEAPLVTIDPKNTSTLYASAGTRNQRNQQLSDRHHPAVERAPADLQAQTVRSAVHRAGDRGPGSGSAPAR
jgi:hypothetical protein